MDAAADPPKKFSHMFFTPKTRFVSIMVTTPFFGVLHFMFKNGGAQRAKWTFLDLQKMSKNRGSKSVVYSSLRRFWTTYFRRFYTWNINGIGLYKKPAKVSAVGLSHVWESLAPLLPKKYQSHVFRINFSNKSISITNLFLGVFAFSVSKVGSANGVLDKYTDRIQYPHKSPRPYHTM